MENPLLAATQLIESLAPGGRPAPIRTPLDHDECTWFLGAVTAGIINFGGCPPGCFRLKKRGETGPDHFDTPAGKPRHLFSKPTGDTAWLNREYIPHIAAYALAIEHYGYSKIHSSFSLYRSFSRDLISKKQGQSYETDAEFYSHSGDIHLKMEAKASAMQTARLVREIEEHGQLTALPQAAAKEVEYVLGLSPAYLWIVGPGSIDPPRHVYAVTVNGTNAAFTPLNDLPEPPDAVT
ncbi:hypothetical protein [Streptosporangium longisporum]|uniref:Endonuclease n=1 Tax=Streptosporangium longisporum TaxID=46187 RepID=A0ABP6KP27_9ACTN